MSARWLVAGVPPEIRSGGDLRAYHIYRDLVARTQADVMPSLASRHLLVHGGTGALALRGPVNVAATQLVSGWLTSVPGDICRFRALDLHDHPVLQTDALGVSLSRGTREQFARRVAANVRCFEWVLVPTESFADLAGVPGDKRLVVPNGADASVITPSLLPSGEPVVALASGAAPGRGIEILLDVVALVREVLPGTRLNLALVATGDASASYLASLSARVSHLPWVQLGEVAQRNVSEFLARASVVAVTHPPGEYFDSALPVKLFDAMAAARPIVTTPRLESARLIRRTGAGVVAGGDRPEDVADALLRILRDPVRARAMGAAGRRAVEAEYDWAILSRRVADIVLAESRR